MPAVCEERIDYNRNYNTGLLVRARYVMPNLAFGDIRWKTEYCGRFAHLLRRVYNLRDTALAGFIEYDKGLSAFPIALLFFTSFRIRY